MTDKTKLEIMIYVFSLVMMMSGVMFYVGIKKIMDAWKEWKRTINYPYLIKMTEEYMAFNVPSYCKPHDWCRTTLALRGLPSGKYLVCLKCGSVSGHPYRVNEPGLEVLANNVKLERERNDLEERQVTRTKEILEADFNYWANTFLKEFSNDPIKNRTLLKKFSVFTVESVNDAAKRAIQEVK